MESKNNKQYQDKENNNKRKRNENENNNNQIENDDDNSLFGINKKQKCNKIKIFKGNWDSKIVNENKDCLFIFGDNDQKKGCKGQSVIRNCKNAHGIPSKKRPSNAKNSFYIDSEFEINKLKIDTAIKELIEKSKNYKFIVLPKNPIGSGLSQLDTKSPKTFNYLQSEINKLSIIFIDDNDHHEETL